MIAHGCTWYIDMTITPGRAGRGRSVGLEVFGPSRNAWILGRRLRWSTNAACLKWCCGGCCNKELRPLRSLSRSPRDISVSDVSVYDHAWRGCKRCVCEVLDACVWIAKVSQEHARELGYCSRRLATLWTRIGSDKFTRSWSKGWIWSKSHCLKKLTTHDLKSLTLVAASKLCQQWRQPVAWWTSVTRAWPPRRWQPVAQGLTAARLAKELDFAWFDASASFCYTTALRYPPKVCFTHHPSIMQLQASSLAARKKRTATEPSQPGWNGDDMDMKWLKNMLWCAIWWSVIDVIKFIDSFRQGWQMLASDVNSGSYAVFISLRQFSLVCITFGTCVSIFHIFKNYLYTLYPYIYIFISSYIYISLYTLCTWYPYIYIHWYSVNVTISVSRLAGLKGKRQNSQPAK